MINLKLSEIAKILDKNINNSIHSEISISGIEINSQKVNANFLFVALKGTNSDGHNYIENAINNGATCLLVEKELKNILIPYIIVEDTINALNLILKELTKDLPLKIAGVTGTNGKTTVHWMQSEILENLNIKSTKIGTFGILNKNFSVKTNLTTPDIITTFENLNESVKNKTDYIFMEVSSHALDQKRVDFIDFDLMLFTNLTQDHLDYHKDMHDYFSAKKLLFRKNQKKQTAIINIDCDYGLKLKEYCEQQNIKTITYGFSENSDFKISDYKILKQKSSFSLSYKNKTYLINSNFFAKYNALNLTASIISAFSYGFKLKDILRILNKIKPVPGRLERVGNSLPTVLVDYAHTPDALKNALSSIKNDSQKLWVVFGCGGDRDKKKRPLMAKACGEFADYIVVTSDNPRSENPESIIEDILASGIKTEFVEVDRSLAIKKTILKANENDLILIAGKGHEDYQILKDKTIYFSDQEEVREALSLRT